MVDTAQRCPDAHVISREQVESMVNGLAGSIDALTAKIDALAENMATKEQAQGVANDLADLDQYIRSNT